MDVLIPQWPAANNIRALSTYRSGGMSSGQYTSFNLASHVGDDAGSVGQNRAELIRLQALPSPPIWLNQVHGNKTIELKKGQSLISDAIAADAAYSYQANIVCSVMTADCLPLLMCNRAGTAVAAVHAGWRGLLNGIIESTVTSLGEPEQLMAWLGPAIGPAKFEVGAEVRAAFVEKRALFSQAFQVIAGDKFLLDIYLLARMVLLKSGVTAIYGGEHCTVSEPERFYSYRREGQTGRMASLIWLDQSPRGL